MPRVPQDFRAIIHDEFASRCRRNARYSMRAFARDLAVSPSRLSEILSGNHGLSRATAQKIAKGFGYNPDESERFCDLVESAHGRSDAGRKLASLRLRKTGADPAFEALKLDVFNVISDWYHLAIVEMLSLPRFKDDPAWIAGALGITKVEATVAVERLLRVGLLARNKGRLVAVTQHNSAIPAAPSAAIKSFHRQILARAADALETQTVDQRDMSAIMEAIPQALVPKVKEMIKDFRRSFSAEARKAGAQERVYCLAIQLFDLTPFPTPNEPEQNVRGAPLRPTKRPLV